MDAAGGTTVIADGGYCGTSLVIGATIQGWTIEKASNARFQLGCGALGVAPPHP